MVAAPASRWIPHYLTSRWLMLHKQIYILSFNRSKFLSFLIPALNPSAMTIHDHA
jgi:hypothetical protein